MPTRLIEGLSDIESTFFYCDGDGNYVPLSGTLQDIVFDEVKYNPETFVPDFTETGELFFSVRMNRRTSKRIRKAFGITGRFRRQVRSMKRRKEKIRRNMHKSIHGGDENVARHKD